MTVAVAATVAEIIDEIEVSESLCAASYRGREITESGPAKLTTTLAQMIYSNAHAGLQSERMTRPSTWHDEALERRLAAAVPVGRMRIRAELLHSDAGALLVDVGGVHLTVPADSEHLESRTGNEVILVLPTQWPKRSPGFFMADSPKRAYKAFGPILRIYVRCESSDRALKVWESLGGILPSLEVPWRAKVLSIPQSFPRNDAIVIYLNRPAWHESGRILEFLEENKLADPGGSMLASRRSAGIGLAFEPADTRPTYSGLSFGQHRSRLIADGVIRAARDNIDARTAVEESFRNGLVDPAAPWRNSTSPLVLEIENTPSPSLS